jgi:hypothetical protein
MSLTGLVHWYPPVCVCPAPQDIGTVLSGLASKGGARLLQVWDFLFRWVGH